MFCFEAAILGKLQGSHLNKLHPFISVTLVFVRLVGKLEPYPQLTWSMLHPFCLVSSTPDKQPFALTFTPNLTCIFLERGGGG